MEENSSENLEILKQTIFEQIHQVLMLDTLTEAEKVDLLEEAFLTIAE